MLSIILGAFGAHGLEGKISEHGIDVWNTAAEYQMYAGLGLLIVSLSASRFDFDIKWFARLLIVGTIIFSGLLYFAALQDIYPALKILGAFVPIGGTLMIVSWGVLIVNLMKSK